MWKISDTRWLNPLAISYVRDNPARQTITVYFMGGKGTDPDTEDYRGPERQAVLDFLANESRPYVPRSTAPPPERGVYPDDEPPF
jgi:hypothetical protein